MSVLADLDDDVCYAAVRSRDRRFDGVFFTAVRTTGIYCRPSCPARTPSSVNVSFHPTAAAAQAAGYRACKRCRPDATPDSPSWDVAATAAGRAMRLIADGVVDREGVDGLARRVGYTPRHLSRLLTAELGAGPLALARAQRAQTARTLLETTDLPITDIAFAAGFASVRQFNDTVREVYDTNPTGLRGRRGGAAHGSLDLRIAVRTPFAGHALRDFLAAHLVPGVEVAGPDWYARTLDLPHGAGTVRIELRDDVSVGVGFVPVRLELADLRDTAAALERTRRLVDAACDPVAVDAHLGADPLLAPLVAARPGLRVAGHVDGPELAVRAVIGQQVSVAGACTVAGRIVEALGEPIDSEIAGLGRLFPRPEALAAADPLSLPMPRARGRAVVALAAAIADGLCLDRGADRDVVRAALVALPGIGPWTADYVALRALGDPDVFLPTDLAARRLVADRVGALGAADGVPDVATVARAWRPWRSYALCHLWQTVLPATPVPTVPSTEKSR